MKKGQPSNPEIVKTVPYYDMAFFAKRIKGETFFTVGLIDNTCCPTSVYAAYNNIPGRKNIHLMPDKGHVGTSSPAYLQRLRQVVQPAGEGKK